MKSGYVLWAIMTLSACSNPHANAPDDPNRREIVTACSEQKIYRSKPTEKTQRYCGCIYDKTMKNLTADEQLVARFYLGGQIGLNFKDRPEFKSMDISAMGTASEAIGKAVAKCPRP